MQENALIAKTILDASGHVSQLETMETIHSRETLRKAIGPQLEVKKTDNRKTLDTGTINKEVKTPLTLSYPALHTAVYPCIPDITKKYILVFHYFDTVIMFQS